MHLSQSGDAKFDEVYLHIQNLNEQVLEMASGKLFKALTKAHVPDWKTYDVDKRLVG